MVFLLWPLDDCTWLECCIFLRSIRPIELSSPLTCFVLCVEYVVCMMFAVASRAGELDQSGQLTRGQKLGCEN